jgi:hypothetical protein
VIFMFSGTIDNDEMELIEYLGVVRFMYNWLKCGSDLGGSNLTIILLLLFVFRRR